MMRPRLTFTSLSLLLAAVHVFADPVVTERIPDGVIIHENSHSLRLQVCEDKIVRVIGSASNAPEPNLDFVVRREWPKATFTVEQNTNTVWLRTKALTVRVDEPRSAVTFLDVDGNVLLSELPGARVMRPAGESLTAEDSFATQPGEFQYGLGQYQEGLWDWRGLPREFRQQNMTATVPMLVSSRGYGLLWNNASLTDFNPLETEIPLESTSDSVVSTNSKVPKIFTWRGAFTNGESGEYAFFAGADNNRQEFTINIDGHELVGISNYWTPFTLCGVTGLPAHKVCNITVRGGTNVKLFVGRRGDRTTFRSQVARSVDYVFFYGPELPEVVAGYRRATGEAPMFPKWAFGFWQCRERYSSQQQLLDAAAEFRDRQIPLDLIVQDWKYWGPHGWGSYEWDLKNYPDPRGMIDTLHKENVKFMISVWCNPHGQTLTELTNHHATVGEWIDVFNPQGRAIRWKHLNDSFYKIGTDAWWGDATEPGDTGNTFAGRQTFMGPSDLYRNAYSLLASQSIYEGQRATEANKRVCILTRSAFSGLQRYASTVWSGDIAGDWITLRRQIPAGLNFCLAGIPYWTTDCGGFWHPTNQYTSEDYNELLARWFEWSTFGPILRIHGGATETEMWKWLAKTQSILKSYDELRYRLLPYNYSVASRVTRDGDTMMRALAMDFRSDTNALAVGDEYMFGPAFLVAPVTEPKASTKQLYLPAGTAWVNFWTGESVSGGRNIQAAAPLERIPIFVRAGSIVPLGPALQYVDEKSADPVELRIYPGENGAFTIYEDEGDNYNYEKGAFATIPISWNDKQQTLTIGARAGKFPGMLKNRTFHIIAVGPGKGVGMSNDSKGTVVHYNGKQTAVRLNR